MHVFSILVVRKVVFDLFPSIVDELMHFVFSICETPCIFHHGNGLFNFLFVVGFFLQNFNQSFPSGSVNLSQKVENHESEFSLDYDTKLPRGCLLH